MNFTKYFNPRQTPQSEPIPGKEMAANSAGGYSFAVDDWQRLLRFLILGSEGGTYYISEKQLTQENALSVIGCIAADGKRTVETIVAVSEGGRAPKNDPAIFALAVAATVGDEATRKLALNAVSQVCRTGTHLFHFAQYAGNMRGWGRGLRSAVARWYQQPARKLALQVVKYQQRDGWSHRDLLRLTHPKATTPQHNDIYNWVVKGGWEWVGDEPHPEAALQLLWAFEKAKRAGSVGEVVRLINDYNLPREAIPTHYLNQVAVWDALLGEGTMPTTALIRNLATMTRVGLLVPGAAAVGKVVAALQDGERLRKARIHPIAVLAALRTYGSGQGVRGGNTWQPVTQIVDALDSAFYRSFGNVASTGKRWLLALDVSGSMGAGNVGGVPNLSPRDASAAMCLVTAATEAQYHVVGFQDKLLPLTISPRQRLDDAIKAVSGLPFGSTDCAQPMLYAMEKKLKVDVFTIYTDSETWVGDVHPVQALQQYRQKMAIPARLIVVGMTSNSFSIADPDDGGMLDVAGFDTATPNVMADFVRGFSAEAAPPTDAATEDEAVVSLAT